MGAHVVGRRRDRLAALVRRFRAGVEAIGLALTGSTTPIQPVVVGTPEKALRASETLWRRGFWVAAIRPPLCGSDRPAASALTCPSLPRTAGAKIRRNWGRSSCSRPTNSATASAHKRVQVAMRRARTGYCSNSPASPSRKCRSVKVAYRSVVGCWPSCVKR